MSVLICFVAVLENKSDLLRGHQVFREVEKLDEKTLMKLLDSLREIHDQKGIVITSVTKLDD